MTEAPAGGPDGEDGAAGLGPVAVFDNLTFEQEQEQLAAAAAWQRAKLAAGYGAITWPPEFGGAGLPAAYEEAFGRKRPRSRYRVGMSCSRSPSSWPRPPSRRWAGRPSSGS